MNPTFTQLCEATGKTNEEIAEKAGLKLETLLHYQKINKPSLSAKNAVAEILQELGIRHDDAPEEDKFAEFSTLSVDREAIPKDFTDDEDWHFVHCYDFQPGGDARVNADVAMLKAGDEFGRYGEAHKFSDNYIVMKCPRSHYLKREARDQKAAADAWPTNSAVEGEGISTKVEKGQRFIQGSAGVPTGEPVSA